jgi:aspartate ammonia-lyase
MGDVAAVSAAWRVLALDLGKLASDLRLMASGPRTGLDELHLPAVQPGSSIMPGKVNPSVPEMVNQVVFQVMGHDATVSAAAEQGQLELNVMMPVIAHNVLSAVRILGNAADVLEARTVREMQPNAAMLAYWVERSAALATALAPKIGYAAAAALTKRSVETGESIRALVLKEGLLTPEEATQVLDLRRMTEPGVPGQDG